MPIYAYRCASCGHAKDVLRKLSDPPLTQCPACGAQTFSKQVTAAGFQLKGSGWYATDFKGDKSAKKTDAADGAKTDAGKSETAKTDTSNTESGKTDTSKTESGKTEGSKPETPKDSGTTAKSGDSGGASTSAPGSPKAAAGCGGRCASR
jgi:putative FmdB family regulatory protein